MTKAADQEASWGFGETDEIGPRPSVVRSLGGGHRDGADNTGKTEQTEGTGRETRGNTDRSGRDTGVSTRGETDPGDNTGKTERV